MWTSAERALVGEFGAGQALTDDQFRLLEPLIPPAKPGGRPRTADMRGDPASIAPPCRPRPAAGASIRIPM
jgi:transposase